MGKHQKIPADKVMPEYQMFPEGMWHMLGAVMLMVFSLAILLVLILELVSGWLSEMALVYLHLTQLLAAATCTLFFQGWHRDGSHRAYRSNNGLL